MMVERCPNLKEKIGGLIPNCKSPLYLTDNLPGAQLPPVHWRWSVGLLTVSKGKKEKKKKVSNICTVSWLVTNDDVGKK
jgi:hypothetical protein